MVDYPDLSSLSNSSGIEALIALPNASYIWFWPTILAGLFVIFTLAMYFGEKSLKGTGNAFSAAAISALACIMLAVLGSFLGMFTVVTLVPIVVFGVVIIAIWIMVGK